MMSDDRARISGGDLWRIVTLSGHVSVVYSINRRPGLGAKRRLAIVGPTAPSPRSLLYGDRSLSIWNAFPGEIISDGQSRIFIRPSTTFSPAR